MQYATKSMGRSVIDKYADRPTWVSSHHSTSRTATKLHTEPDKLTAAHAGRVAAR